jgi:hypothetical protein
MKNLQELKDELVNKQQELENFELDESDFEDQYRDYLDELYSPMFGLLPSRILEECDPIQFNCGFTDFMDTIDRTETDEYKQLEEEITNLECQIEDIEEAEE